MTATDDDTTGEETDERVTVSTDEADRYLGEMGEGRLVAALLLMAVAGLVFTVAVFAPAGPITWISWGVTAMFVALTALELRGGER